MRYTLLASTHPLGMYIKTRATHVYNIATLSHHIAHTCTQLKLKYCSDAVIAAANRLSDTYVHDNFLLSNDF